MGEFKLHVELSVENNSFVESVLQCVIQHVCPVSLSQ